MLSQDYLSLRLIRLKSPEHWEHQGAELGFVFPKGGSGTLAPGAHEIRLLPGDVLVLNGVLRGSISAADAAEIVFWFFSANVEHLFPLFGCDEVGKLQRITNNFRSPRHYPASSPLALECHKLLSEVPPRFDLGHRGQLLRVVAGILAAEFKTLRPEHDGFVLMEEHVSQVLEKLSVSDILSLSVGELADRFSCSRRHLNRLFHQHFGLSVAALRMEMRLLKAVALFKDPNAKILNVAEQCGFHHLGLFNTCFKRRFGASPGQWRKSPAATLAAHPPVPFDGGPVCRLHANGLCPWSGKTITKEVTLHGPAAAEDHPALPPDGGADPAKAHGPNHDTAGNGNSNKTSARVKLRFRVDP